MKKKNFKWLLLFTIFLILPITVKAETRLECQYSGILPKPYGIFADDEEEEKISLNIVLDETGFKVTSSIFVNGFYSYKGCAEPGVSIDSCFTSLKEQGIRNFENFDKVRFQGINTLKIENSQYKIVSDDELTGYYVKNGKYTCPQSLQILGSDTVDRVSYNYGIFNVPGSFSDTYCQWNEIKDFVCNQNAVLTLTQAITEATYNENETITKPSSGSCCVYKTTDGTPIYTFLVGSDPLVAGTLYACYGYDCMNCKGQNTYENCLLNSNYSHWLGSEFNDYRKGLANCSQMPESLYYWKDSNGKYKFLSTASERYAKATLDPNSYCVSNNYTAGGVDDVDDEDNNINKDPIDWGNQEEVNCEGILGDELIDFIKKIFRWIQIIAPIFVIIMGSVEFAGAVLQDDKDALKKASSRFIKRLIIAIALFFIPILLSFVLDIFNDITGASSSICGIGE